MISLFFAVALHLTPIAAARLEAPGTSVTILGLVTVPSGLFASSSGDQGFALRDQTGGIWVSVAKNPRLRIGQRVQVSGEIGTKTGKVQLAATAVTPLAGTRLRVQTGEVGPDTLGAIVTIEGAITKEAEDDLPYGYKLWVDDGSGEVQVYISKTTGIDPRAPHLRRGKRVRVTGFSSQYETTYEIEPRGARDLAALPL